MANHEIHHTSVHTEVSAGCLNVTITAYCASTGTIAVGDTIYVHPFRDYRIQGGHDAYAFRICLITSKTRSAVYDIEGDFGSTAATGDFVISADKVYVFNKTETGFTLASERRSQTYRRLRARFFSSASSRPSITVHVENLPELPSFGNGTFVYLAFCENFIMPDTGDGWDNRLTYSVMFSTPNIVDPETGAITMNTSSRPIMSISFRDIAPGDILFAKDHVYGFINTTGGLQLASDEYIPDFLPSRTINFTCGRRTIHLPLTIRETQAIRYIDFHAGQRTVRLAAHIDSNRVTRTFRFVGGQHEVRVSLTIYIPINAIRISDLDPRAIGALDKLTMPDAS